MNHESASPPDAENNAPPLPPLPRHWRSLGAAFAWQGRRSGPRKAMADSTGTHITYADALMKSVALGRRLARSAGPAPYVGVLLPPTVHAAVVNVALTLFDKVPVNLNYSASEAVVNSAIAQCGNTSITWKRSSGTPAPKDALKLRRRSRRASRE